MVHDSTTIGQADVDVARKAGWSDEALYDAINNKNPPKAQSVTYKLVTVTKANLSECPPEF